MKLIGVAGTNGAGKDSVGEFLSNNHNWLFVSVSDFLREEAKKRGLPIEREVLRTISADWRRKYGIGVLVDKAVEEFNRSSNRYQGLVAIPMRNPGEAEELKKLGGTLVWVDADPKVRYQRIFNRQRSSEDQKTFEQFLQEEEDEMEHSGDHHTLSLAGVKAKADIFLTNDSPTLEEFYAEIEKVLGLK
jgi:dephospho-CoA kinase